MARKEKRKVKGKSKRGKKHSYCCDKCRKHKTSCGRPDGYDYNPLIFPRGGGGGGGGGGGAAGNFHLIVVGQDALTRYGTQPVDNRIVNAAARPANWFALGEANNGDNVDGNPDPTINQTGGHRVITPPAQQNPVKMNDINANRFNGGTNRFAPTVITDETLLRPDVANPNADLVYRADNDVRDIPGGTRLVFDSSSPSSSISSDSMNSRTLVDSRASRRNDLRNLPFEDGVPQSVQAAFQAHARFMDDAFQNIDNFT